MEFDMYHKPTYSHSITWYSNITQDLITSDKDHVEARIRAAPIKESD